MCLRVFFLSLAFFLILAFDGSGQNASTASLQQAISYRTAFYNFYFTNPDSALYYAQKMTAEPSHKSYLREMIHEDFYGMFHEKFKEKMAEGAPKNKASQWEKEYQKFFGTIYSTLTKMAADKNPALVQTTKPLLYWVDIKLNKQDTKKVSHLINEFNTTQLEQGNLYENAAARYALFIYEEIAAEKGLEDQALKLLSAMIEKLSSLDNNEHVYSATITSLEKRAWTRFIYSYATNLMAWRLLEEDDQLKAGTYFKKSFASSPDITDMRFPNEYGQDVFLLCDGSYQYLQTDYLNYLEKYANDQLLPAYIDLAIKDPVTYKEKLKQTYETQAHEKSFADFWLDAVNSRLEKAPAFNLSKIDGQEFSSLASTGKWVLIDFWGTWCGPCRAEHPTLQEFYKDFIAQQDDIQLLTIACRDKAENVKKYLSDYSYSFPVAMSDGIVNNAFNVFEYPTKVLITPQGKYLTIPNHGDWINFVKAYASQ